MLDACHEARLVEEYCGDGIYLKVIRELQQMHREIREANIREQWNGATLPPQLDQTVNG